MKRNITLKKLLALTFALLLLTLSACQSAPSHVNDPAPSAQSSPDPAERPTVTVCMDLYYEQTPERLKDLILDYAPEFNKSYKLKIDCLSDLGTNRKAAMDRIRVELMAGKGPDLFLCRNPQTDNIFPSTENQGLFQYPKALMERRMFLPLDDYIKDAKYMEWDKLYPQIMEAGRNDEGQQILPITWMMNFTGISAESYELPDGLPMTFEEMLQSDDPGIIRSTWSFNYCDSLGEVADYKNDTPSFTEEELLAHLEGLRENNARHTKELEESLGASGPIEFSRHSFTQFRHNSPDYVLIPQYNRQGGATAYISSFGAVNINTDVPEAAFTLLDLMLSKDAQQSSDFFMWDLGAPVHMELPRDKVRIETESGGVYYAKWFIKEHNDQQLQALIKQINAVEFPTPVHTELTELYGPYMQAQTQEEREKLVHDAYRTITMMLAES